MHSVNTTTALTEVAIAKSKSDFVLINGKAVVYEIKTELDNLERLSSQVDDYYKAFDHVAVVTYEKNLQKQLQKVLDSIDKPVGIYVLRKMGSWVRSETAKAHKRFRQGNYFQVTKKK